MNRCYEEKVGEKKRKKGVEDKIKNQVEDKRWKDMEKTKKKEDNIMEEKQMMDRDKIKKGKGNHKEWEVKRKKEKGKHVESKKKADDKTQQKYHEEKKEIVKYTKDEDNQEKYALKHAEKLTKSKEDVKVNETIPQFCILISPEDITGKLRIPLAPNTFLESELLGVISLKGPSGNIWRANLVLDSDGLCFVNGWKEFSIDHHLESGDFLVFRYDGHSQFSVLVFDTTECAKKSAFYACPGSTLVVESDNAALDIDANDTLHPYVGDNEGSNAIDTLQYNELALCIDGAKTPKVAVAEHDRSINGAHASQHDIQENGSLPKFPGSSRKAKGGLFGDSFWAPVDAVLDTDSDDTLENYERVNEGNHAAGNVQGNERTLACAKNTANDIEQEEGESSRKTKDRWSKDPFGTSQEVRSSRLNSMKDSSSTIFGRSDEVPSCGKFVTPMANTINKMKIVPQQDKDVAKIPEPKVFISQRLVITEKDKENPLKRATRLHSNYPFTLQMMKASHVYPAFFMIIPSEFVRKYLPKVNTKMTLWDHQGRQWRVNYVYHKSRGAFCRGWGAFVIANNIEKDDICLFELFHENNIKVGVFGVAQETTPCIPS